MNLQGKMKAEKAAKTYQVDVTVAGPYSYMLDNLDFFTDPGPLPEMTGSGAKSS